MPNLRRLGLALAGLSATLVALPAAEAAPRPPMPLGERVEARVAIERVYWDHRVWPDANPLPKTSAGKAVRLEDVEARVADDLAKSEALEHFYGLALGDRELQAELNRMAARSRRPEVLRELYRAVGDDPVRAAECLARPLLADRLLRGAYASDGRWHAAVRERAERVRRVSLDREGLRSASDDYQEIGWIRVHGGESTAEDVRADRSARRVEPGEWERRVSLVAGWFGVRSAAGGTGPRGAAGAGRDAPSRFSRIPVGIVGPLNEEPEAFFAAIVIEKKPDRLRVGIARWLKRPFDAWWAEARASLPTDAPPPATSDESIDLTLPVVTAETCVDDSWLAVPDGGAPEERDSHSAVWTGSEMIVWGGAGVAGALGSGSRYDPATDTWSPVSRGAGVPSARWGHTAVWTGTEMIVWGGQDGADYTNTGARYDPGSDTWSPIAVSGAVPSARDSHTAVWTGTEMIVWGGDETAGNLGTGGRYRPSSDSWTATSPAAAPTARYLHTAVWSGSEMIVWGGFNDTWGHADSGAKYDPAAERWTAIPSDASTPSPRSRHVAVWTGSRMVVWGGSGAGGYTDTGGRYDPAADSWTPTAVGADTPSARYLHTGVWTGTYIVVWGGYKATGYTSTGARYDPVADRWHPTSGGPGTPAGRGFHSAVWTGSEMIVWGGYYYDGADHELDTGGRYSPTTDRWIPTSAWGDRRFRHTAVWTGSEMIVWGGESSRATAPPTLRNSGGRYTPATDSWSSTALDASTPSPRDRHTAVWTGSEMIAWGGESSSMPTGTGARYNPVADSWATVANGSMAPSARYLHTAVWTGSEMVIWGGWDGAAATGTGGRYSPASDGWTATPAGPEGRYGHTAVWSGTEMIVWGGMGGGGALSTGGRLNGSGSWSPTSTGTGTPEARAYHTAVWTGSEMIVWGGAGGGGALGSGARYSPTANGWTPTSGGAGVPSARSRHTAAWTGSEMIVWGGANGTVLGSGGRYAPGTDSWRTMASGAGSPSARDSHTAVWTGSEMIVWGGRDAVAALDTGGRYCASSCSSPAPTGTPSLSLSKISGTARLSWSAVAGAGGYDAARGPLKLLRSSGGDFVVATDACLANDLVGTTVDDATPAPTGDGFWYLVRGVSCGGSGTYDDRSTSQKGSRDAEIDASLAGCP